MGEKRKLYETKACSLIDKINALKKKGARSNQNLLAIKKKPAAKKAQTTGNIEQMDKQAN